MFDKAILIFFCAMVIMVDAGKFKDCLEDHGSSLKTAKKEKKECREQYFTEKDSEGNEGAINEEGCKIVAADNRHPCSEVAAYICVASDGMSLKPLNEQMKENFKNQCQNYGIDIQ